MQKADQIQHAFDFKGFFNYANDLKVVK